jgi:hypothetical protein
MKLSAAWSWTLWQVCVRVLCTWTTPPSQNGPSLDQYLNAVLTTWLQSLVRNKTGLQVAYKENHLHWAASREWGGVQNDWLIGLQMAPAGAMTQLLLMYLTGAKALHVISLTRVLALEGVLLSPWRYSSWNSIAVLSTIIEKIENSFLGSRLKGFWD